MPFMGPSTRRIYTGGRVVGGSRPRHFIFDQRARGTFIAPETEASELLDFDQGALKLFRCSTAALDHRAVPRVARSPRGRARADVGRPTP